MGADDEPKTWARLLDDLKKHPGLVLGGLVIAGVAGCLGAGSALNSLVDARVKSQLEATLRDIGPGLVPTSAVIAFDGDRCPKGWSSVKNAEGRAIIGANDNSLIIAGSSSKMSWPSNAAIDSDGKNYLSIVQMYAFHANSANPPPFSSLALWYCKRTGE